MARYSFGKVRSRRAWVYVLSVLALLVPAAGIAYLGAFSYQNERGAVSAQTEAQAQAAIAIEGRIARAVDEGFTAIEAATTRTPVPRGPLAAPLAKHWFWIDDRDIESKRIFAFMMLLFTLSDHSEKEPLPLITIPAQ